MNYKEAAIEELRKTLVLAEKQEADCFEKIQKLSQELNVEASDEAVQAQIEILNAQRAELEKSMNDVIAQLSELDTLLSDLTKGDDFN